MMPFSASFFLKVVATETLSNTASTATEGLSPHLDAGQHRLLLQRDAQLLVSPQQLGIDLVQALRLGAAFGAE